MTIASSGSLVFPTELNTELRRTGSLTMPDAQTRWLCDTPAGALTFPTDFYGKSAFKLVDTTSYSSLGTSHSFASTSFGSFYTGRRIVIVVECRNKVSSTTSGWNLTSVSIGGNSGSNTVPAYYQDGAGSTIFIGLTTLSTGDTMTATSGTVSFNSTASTQCRLFVISVANAGTSSDSAAAYGAAIDPVTISGGITTPSNGFLLAASASYHSAATITSSVFSGGGWTELVDTVSGSYNLNISVKNRQTSGAKTVSCTWNSGDPTQAVVIGESR